MSASVFSRPRSLLLGAFLAGSALALSGSSAMAAVKATPLSKAAVERATPQSGSDPVTPYADPSTWGPYKVGVHPLEVPSWDRGDPPLQAWIWYPAQAVPGASPYVYIDDPEFGGAISGEAVEDAPFYSRQEPFATLAFSHGNGGMGYQSPFLTEHLASHGYIIITCNHPGNTYFDYDPTTFVTGLMTRPKDISALLDALEDLNLDGTSPFFQKVDMSKAGMLGHSFGGYTTLAIGGARLNLKYMPQRCAEGDQDACLLMRTARTLGITPGLRDLSDRRIKAIAPLTPWSWEPFRAEGLSYLKIPLQVHGGGLDDTTPMETQIEPVWLYAQSPKSMLEIYDAGHMTWTDICKAWPDTAECSEPFVEMDYGHMLINTYVTSHFKFFLEGDTRYQPYLEDLYAQNFADDLLWQEALGL